MVVPLAGAFPSRLNRGVNQRGCTARRRATDCCPDFSADQKSLTRVRHRLPWYFLAPLC
jgi:hypothetical protein